MAEAATSFEQRDPSRITITNPATLEHVADVPVTTPEQLAEAVSRARTAQKDWGARSFRERAEALYRFRDEILENSEKFAETLCSETGKPHADAYAVELIYVCDAITYWAKNAERFLIETKVSPHLLKTKAAYSLYQPMGVIGFITPWNFPFVLSIGEALPALMAGNAAIIKPSEVTPLVALFGAEMWRQAGLPENVLQVVPGYGETGSQLIDHVDGVMFTGSVATGRKVAVKCAEQLKPCSLELGGKDPMIVLKDADLERAANACVWGGLVNSGQVCLSMERIYVEEPIYDDFVKLVQDKVGKVRQGAWNEEVDIGSMTFPKQIETVERHVKDAIERGAKVLTGGKRKEGTKGLFYEPTILTDVTHDMACMREETFGPTIPIMKVQDEDEAVRLANDSNFGLGAAVFTKDLDRGRVVARKIEAGGICVNDVLVHFAVTDVPMGGVKESGLGRRHGPDGIRKYCNQKTIVVDRFGQKSEPTWFPMSRRKTSIIRRVMNLFYRSRWKQRLFG